MLWGIIVVVVLLILGVLWFIVKQNKQYDRISFKETLELTDLPIVTFHHFDNDNNDIRLNFLLDTGSNRSMMSSSAIEKCKHTYINAENSLCGMDGIQRTVQNAVVTLRYNNRPYSDVFQVSDIPIFDGIKEECGIVIHGVIGNTFFNKYKYIIDFDSLVAYSSK